MGNKYSVHWLDEILKEILQRNPKKITLATGKTPSGHIHIGILREILICEALRRKFTELGNKVKFYLFLDDFDAAKRFPSYIEKDFQEENLGKPFALIPCPNKNCGCKSYGFHYGNELISTFEDFGIKCEVIWSFELYQSTEMQEKIKIALENNDLIKDILKKYILPTLDESKKRNFKEMLKKWMPAMVLCERCNKIQHKTTEGMIVPNRVVSYLKETDKVEYDCPSCGYNNKIHITSGRLKLNWRVDWPAKWSLFHTTCEPAGKDHSVKGGAYDTGLEICRKIYNYEGPVKVPYEWLRLGDQDMKTSKGIVYTPQRYLEVADPEIYRMLIYRTNPMKHISLRIEEIPQYYDYFEKLEKVYYNIESLESPQEEEFMKYVYSLAKIKNPPKQIKSKISFNLLIFLAQIQNILSLESLYSKAISWIGENERRFSIDEFKILLKRTSNWINETKKIIKDNYDSKKVKYLLNKMGIFSIPDIVDKNIISQLNQKQKKGLLKFKKFLSHIESLDPDLIQNEIFKIAKDIIEISPKELFKAFYLIILGKNSGPRLGPFISLIGKDWLLDRMSFLET